DGGKHWVTKSLPEDLAPSDIPAIAFDPVDSNTIYLGARNFYKSVDLGNHWQQLSSNNHYETMVDIVFAGTSGKKIFTLIRTAYLTYFKKSVDGGKNFLQYNFLRDPTFMEAAPDDPSVLYSLASTPSGSYGILKSTNAGKTWKIKNNGIPS